MKLVTAIVRPDRVDAISAALERFGVNGLTVSQASGYGRQRGHTEVYRGAEYNSDLLPKMRLEVLVNEDALAGVMAAIEEGGRTGRFGDGKIWIIDVSDAVRVRTGSGAPRPSPEAPARATPAWGAVRWGGSPGETGALVNK